MHVWLLRIYPFVSSGLSCFLGTRVGCTGLECTLTWVTSLRAACFNRRVCVRCPFGNRFAFVLPDLFNIVVISLSIIKKILMPAIYPIWYAPDQKSLTLPTILLIHRDSGGCKSTLGASQARAVSRSYTSG